MKLRELKNEKKKILEEVIETESFKNAKELLERLALMTATSPELMQPMLPCLMYNQGVHCPVLYILHTLYMIIIITCNMYNI